MIFDKLQKCLCLVTELSEKTSETVRVDLVSGFKFQVSCSETVRKQFRNCPGKSVFNGAKFRNCPRFTLPCSRFCLCTLPFLSGKPSASVQEMFPFRLKRLPILSLNSSAFVRVTSAIRCISISYAHLIFFYSLKYGSKKRTTLFFV